MLTTINLPHYNNSLMKSPDGNKIAFISECKSEGGLFLYTIDADETNFKQLSATWITNFSWSPYNKIVYLDL